MLVLDEATGFLDARNESQIIANLKGLPITQVVIAHRAETLRKADRILYVTNGQIFAAKEGGETRPRLDLGEAV